MKPPSGAAGSRAVLLGWGPFSPLIGLRFSPLSIAQADSAWRTRLLAAPGCAKEERALLSQ